MTRYTIFQLAVMIAATAILFYFEHLIAAFFVSLLTVAIATLALAAPSLLHRFQAMGKRVGLWVGTGIGILFLTAVYFTLFVPASLLLRIARIDLLNRRFPTQEQTNWLDRVNYGEDTLLYRKLYTRPHTAGRSKKATA